MQRRLLAGLVSVGLAGVIAMPLVAAWTVRENRSDLAASSSATPAPKLRSPNFRLPTPQMLSVTYVGSPVLAQDLGDGSARPTALATGDFNEDGVADLVCAYSSPFGGILTLHRGTALGIFPRNDPGSEPARNDVSIATGPFEDTALIFALPVAPDFIEAGDFDGDGHWDLLAAERGVDGLFLRAGDGRGGLAPVQPVDLPGPVSALIAGEINRADGLADIAVGIDGRDGPAVLVFEGPDGAIGSEPETFPLAEPPIALALGQLDGDLGFDLAVAVGDELAIIHGRDRRLSLDADLRATVGPARVDHLVMPTKIDDLAIGDFVWDPYRRQEIAALLEDGTLRVLSRDGRERTSGYLWTADSPPIGMPSDARAGVGEHRPRLHRARVSGLPLEELVVLDPHAGRLHLLLGEIREECATGESAGPCDPGDPVSSDLAGAPIAVLPMRLNQDAISDLVILREGATAPEIIASTAASTFTVTNTDDSGNGSLREAIKDANSSAGVDTIVFDIPALGPHTIILSSPLPSVTEAVTLDAYTQPGAQANTVPLPGGSDAVLQIVLTTDDLDPAPALVLQSGSCAIRGLVIQGFLDDGIRILSSGNFVEGNYIGTSVDGTESEGNVNGIRIAFPDNTIGGTTPGARNLISGNADDGIEISGLTTSGNLVQGNFIGTDVTATSERGNRNGIQILSPDNTIGGTTAGSGNIISGNNDDGIDLQLSSASGNLIQGNLIGPEFNGTVENGNDSDGVQVLDAPNNTVGGTTAAARNIISGNDDNGVFIDGAEAEGNLVQGNFIGSDVEGGDALGNDRYGIEIQDAPNNAVGGAAAEAGNVVSGNGWSGVFLSMSGTTQCQVQGNLVGTDASGAAGLGNGWNGIEIRRAPGNSVGGTEATSRNVISSNARAGIFIVQEEASENLVQGNLIGTDIGGAVGLGNGWGGVEIRGSAGNTVGGIDPGAANTIASNGIVGVLVTGGTGNTILGNSIFANTVLGIDLGNIDGVTGNDAVDEDVGPNDLQNFPVLTAASADASNTTVAGTLGSTPDTSYRIEFFSNTICDGSGNGQGKTFLGSTNVTTDGTGNAFFNAVVPTATLEESVITATATDAGGNTSEFSECFDIGCGSLAVFGQTVLALDVDTLGWAMAQDVRVARGDLADVGTYAVTDVGALLGVTSFNISADRVASGGGFYYVVRPEACGSWQTALGAEPDRDAVLP